MILTWLRGHWNTVTDYVIKLIVNNEIHTPVAITVTGVLFCCRRIMTSASGDANNHRKAGE